MRTIIEEVYSNDNDTLDPTVNSDPFRLGLRLRPISPPHSSDRPANQPNVTSSQQECTTTAPHENRNTQSSSHSSPARNNPSLGDADDSEPPHDSDDEYGDSPLPTPRRLRTKFKRPRIPAQASISWQRHVFRLVERNGRRYYDVRHDAVSSSDNAEDLGLIVQYSF
jgi:hypothetical protein